MAPTSQLKPSHLHPPSLLSIHFSELSLLPNQSAAAQVRNQTQFIQSVEVVSIQLARF